MPETAPHPRSMPPEQAQQRSFALTVFLAAAVFVFFTILAWPQLHRFAAADVRPGASRRVLGPRKNFRLAGLFSFVGLFCFPLQNCQGTATALPVLLACFRGRPDNPNAGIVGATGVLVESLCRRQLRLFDFGCFAAGGRKLSRRSISFVSRSSKRFRFRGGRLGLDFFVLRRLRCNRRRRRRGWRRRRGRRSLRAGASVA